MWQWSQVSKIPLRAKAILAPILRKILMRKTFLCCLLLLWMGGCTTPAPKSPDVVDQRPVVTLADGSRCAQPADFDLLRDTENTARLRELFLSDGKPEEWMPRLREWKIGYGEADAI